MNYLLFRLIANAAIVVGVTELFFPLHPHNYLLSGVFFVCGLLVSALTQKYEESKPLFLKKLEKQNTLLAWGVSFMGMLLYSTLIVYLYITFII